MLDQIASAGPAGEPSGITEQSNQSIRWVIPLVLVGFALSLCSLLVLLWPVRTSSDGILHLTSHLARLTDELVSGAPLIRTLVDFSLYGLMVAGFIFILLAWMRNNRRMLVGILGVGLLGIAYSSGMALYTGPMVSICGFSLMALGGLVALAALPYEEPGDVSPVTVTPTEMNTPTERTENQEIGDPKDGLNTER